jgi:hypothetical protein
VASCCFPLPFSCSHSRAFFSSICSRDEKVIPVAQIRIADLSFYKFVSSKFIRILQRILERQRPPPHLSFSCCGVSLGSVDLKKRKLLMVIIGECQRSGVVFVVEINAKTRPKRQRLASLPPMAGCSLEKCNSCDEFDSFSLGLPLRSIFASSRHLLFAPFLFSHVGPIDVSEKLAELHFDFEPPRGLAIIAG